MYTPKEIKSLSIISREFFVIVAPILQEHFTYRYISFTFHILTYYYIISYLTASFFPITFLHPLYLDLPAFPLSLSQIFYSCDFNIGILTEFHQAKS